MTADAVEESFVGKAIRRAVDRSLARLLDLPPATNRYRVIRGERIPMRDGAELLADRFVPQTPNPLGTVLIRSPYGRGYPVAQFFAQPYAARGMHVVIQSIRGTAGSTGDFAPAVHEAQDGQDTVAWLRRQPWFGGTFATFGSSYLGFTQWAILREPPPELKAAVILCAPHDFSASWSTGAFALDDYLSLSMAGVVSGASAEPLKTRLRAVTGRNPDPKEPTPTMSLRTAGRTVLGSETPWFDSWVSHSDRDDEFWDPMRHPSALERSEVPVLLVNGWQDVFLEQTLQQYARLRARGVEVALTIGPWTHAKTLRNGVSTFAPEAFDWLNSHLSASATSTRRHDVRVSVAGHDWVGMSRWPPEMPEHAVHLQPGGRLGAELPEPDARPSSFTFDPADPTPTIGGRLMSPTVGGVRDDTSLAERADVLAFTGDPLASELFLVGDPVLELTHSSNNPHVDVFARLSQVDAEGRSTNVTEGFRRLPPRSDHAEPHVVRLELDAIAHRFPEGSRIRVVVAGGSYPRFAPNRGTVDQDDTADGVVPVQHLVHHGAGGTSRLLLPAGDRPPD